MALNNNSKIYVAGHQGLVGSALMRQLTVLGPGSSVITRTFQELDLRNQQAVDTFFNIHKPTHVFLAAAHVGGIKANIDFPAEFIYNNLAIQTNVINAAYTHKTEKLLFFGSSCIYPRLAAQPIKEEYLLTGALETTNQPYAIAKIAGLALCAAYNQQYGTQFICCMPTNIYGPGDNFDEHNSHVIPALIKKIYAAHIAQKPYVTLWGTGSPRREFIYVDDLAQAAIFLMNNYTKNEIINIGTGVDITIAEVAQKIKNIIKFKGKIIFDTSMPDGVIQKLLCTQKINNLGWEAETPLDEGLKKTVAWFTQHNNKNNNLFVKSALNI